MIIKQKGAALAITLLILFIVTLLGLGGIQVTQMQEKMSSNLQDKELSFNAAETALVAAESWLLNQTAQPAVEAACSSYPCVVTAFQNVDFTSQSSSWWGNNSASYSGNLHNITTSPRYIIEFLQFIPDSPEIGTSASKSKGVYYYQITARGTGSSDDSVSMLQTSTARRY